MSYVKMNLHPYTVLSGHTVQQLYNAQARLVATQAEQENSPELKSDSKRLRLLGNQFKPYHNQYFTYYDTQNDKHHTDHHYANPSQATHRSRLVAVNLALHPEQLFDDYQRSIRRINNITIKNQHLKTNTPAVSKELFKACTFHINLSDRAIYNTQLQHQEYENKMIESHNPAVEKQLALVEDSITVTNKISHQQSSAYQSAKNIEYPRIHNYAKTNQANLDKQTLQYGEKIIKCFNHPGRFWETYDALNVRKPKIKHYKTQSRYEQEDKLKQTSRARYYNSMDYSAILTKPKSQRSNPEMETDDVKTGIQTMKQVGHEMDMKRHRRAVAFRKQRKAVVATRENEIHDKANVMKQQQAKFTQASLAFSNYQHQHAQQPHQLTRSWGSVTEQFSGQVHNVDKRTTNHHHLSRQQQEFGNQGLTR